MDNYITGNTIKKLRKEKGLTQKDLAERLGVTDKAVSKWERGNGLPDITLLEPISRVFDISPLELISGITVNNGNVSANMLKLGFYVCPVCGNIINSTGGAVISCHGINLPLLSAEEPDEGHKINVEICEDEYFVKINHKMEKDHYISFISALSDNRVQTVKLYPEGNAEARFKMGWVKCLYYYCNKDGMFYKNL